jgi:hypothetical protein
MCTWYLGQHMIVLLSIFNQYWIMMIPSFLNWTMWPIIHSRQAFNKTSCSCKTDHHSILVIFNSWQKDMKTIHRGLPQAFNSYYKPAKRHFEWNVKSHWHYRLWKNNEQSTALEPILIGKALLAASKHCFKNNFAILDRPWCIA